MDPFEIPKLSLLGTAHERVNFDDAIQAFRAQKTWELVCAAVGFRLCKSRSLVRNSNALIAMSYKVFGEWITNRVLRSTFLDIFVVVSMPKILNPVLRC
jgi:hypothetical protein